MIVIRKRKLQACTVPGRAEVAMPLPSRMATVLGQIYPLLLEKEEELAVLARTGTRTLNICGQAVAVMLTAGWKAMCQR